MATVFTLSGYFSIIPQLIDYQLKGEVTEGNTVEAVDYNYFGLDVLAFGLGSIPSEQIATLTEGAANLDAALTGTPGEKIVFGHSMGAVVASVWLVEYGPTSAIDPADLSFIFIGNPARRYGGLFFSEDYAAPVDTPYSVRDIRRQYDGYADYPNVTSTPHWPLAVGNALLGANLLHPYYYHIPAYDGSMPTYSEGNIDYVFAPDRPFWLPQEAMVMIETAYDRPELDEASVVESPEKSYATLGFRYPSNPVTPQGAYYILNDRIPQVALRAHDDTGVFHLMGGLAIPDRQTPERVELQDIKGLVPPWQTIDQKGATEDGVTFIDALYDPIEITMNVTAHGRNPAHCRKVVNHLIASIDAKEEAELSWFTWQLGRWWTKVRWYKNPANQLRQSKRQPLDLVLRADNAFWESYPHVEEFSFSYNDGGDTFSGTDLDDLGTHWTIAYTGAGTGNLYKEDGLMKSSLQNKSAVARFDETTTTDFQIVEATVGTIEQWFFPTSSAIEIWVRMKTTGTPGSDGIRFRISNQILRISSFTAGVETLIREQLMIIPPLPGERFKVVAGTPEVELAIPSGLGLPDSIQLQAEDPNMFTLLRNDVPVVQFKTSVGQIGSGFRGVGLGIHAASSEPPVNITDFQFGDNAQVDQSGFLERINAGDQPAWDRYTCFGPGTFRIANGPGSTEMVEFGPLLPGQVMQVRADPRKYGVKDLSSQPVTVQQSNWFQKQISDFIQFATGGNVPPLLQQIESWLGIQPPQGNPYQLLRGRFSEPIPPKPVGLPAQKHHVKVEILNGTAQSKVIAALTPLRRYPF